VERKCQENSEHVFLPTTQSPLTSQPLLYLHNLTLCHCEHHRYEVRGNLCCTIRLTTYDSRLTALQPFPRFSPFTCVMLPLGGRYRCGKKDGTARINEKCRESVGYGPNTIFSPPCAVVCRFHYRGPPRTSWVFYGMRSYFAMA